MNILFAASEAAPFLKSGGLGDVLEALPAALAKNKDCSVSVVLPYYKKIKDNPNLSPQFVTSFSLLTPLSENYVGIFRLKQKKITYYFIDNEYYFYRDGNPYGHWDDGARFAFFSLAILASFEKIGYFPDIIHLHDWQTAAIPVYLKAFYGNHPAYARMRTVFTIHNIEYQGIMPIDFSRTVMALPEAFYNVMRYGDSVNLMKSAIVLSDRLTTVSRTYAREIMYPYFSHGLDGILKENEYKLSGIVNGINTTLFNPNKDPALPKNFGLSDMSGKAVCKEELQKELGLPVRDDVPLIAMVSRLVSHKGLALVECVLDDIVGRDVQLVVLGTGEKQFEDVFRYAAAAHPDKISAQIRFDTALSSRIYAGSDLFLMPSKSEPCGLSQLIAMRYGTIPIIHEVGGLFDTVPALNTETLSGKGFTFQRFNAHDMLDAIDRACAFFYDKKKLEKHRRALVRYDSSWRESAAAYLSIYSELITENNE